LPSYNRLEKGRLLDMAWRDSGASDVRQVYVPPVDASRVFKYENVDIAQCQRWLTDAIVAACARRGIQCSTISGGASATLHLAITQMTPGSASARFWAGEFGAGHAFIQVEGRLVDRRSNAELFVFVHRERDSGTVGFEDIGGDAGPGLVKQMLADSGDRIVAEWTETPLRMNASE
jgi:hypothetical protein